MNISLIGMPACGKTTIAKELKKLLPDYNLIDTDEKIIQNEKKSINEIFETAGEGHFRKIETLVLEEVLNNDCQIISTGGGIVKNERNLQLLRQKSLVIYLETDIKKLTERASKNTERPLLRQEKLKETLQKLLSERETQYKKAHYTITTKDKAPQIIVKEILEKINENTRSKN